MGQKYDDHMKIKRYESFFISLGSGFLPSITINDNSFHLPFPSIASLALFLSLCPHLILRSISALIFNFTFGRLKLMREKERPGSPCMFRDLFLHDNGWALNLNFFPISTTTINTTAKKKWMKHLTVKSWT